MPLRFETGVVSSSASDSGDVTQRGSIATLSEYVLRLLLLLTAAQNVAASDFFVPRKEESLTEQEAAADEKTSSLFPVAGEVLVTSCLLYTSPSPRD